MYFEYLTFFFKAIESVFLTVKYYSLKKNAFAILMKFFSIYLENTSLHENLLYFQDN